MFSPALLYLLRVLASRPVGISRKEIYPCPEKPSTWVDRALEELVRRGLVEARDDHLIPHPQLAALADKMELLYYKLGKAEAAKELVRLILHRRE